MTKKLIWDALKKFVWRFLSKKILLHKFKYYVESKKTASLSFLSDQFHHWSFIDGMTHLQFSRNFTKTKWRFSNASWFKTSKKIQILWKISYRNEVCKYFFDPQWIILGIKINKNLKLMIKFFCRVPVVLSVVYYLGAWNFENLILSAPRTS